VERRCGPEKAGRGTRKAASRHQHWRAFYERRRYCLADLVALARPDKLADLYSQHAVHSEHGIGFSAENWCVMPKLGNHLYLTIDAGPIHDEAGN
jgi:hypothetical protein